MLPDKNCEKCWKQNDYLKSFYFVLPPSPSRFVFLPLNAFIYGKPDSLLSSAQLDIYVRHLQFKTDFLDPTPIKQSKSCILIHDMFFLRKLAFKV